MDILDDFSGRSRETLTYHCIKEDCNNFHVSEIGGGHLYMVCKLHGEERPLMRCDGKTERDLKEEPEVKDALPKEQADEILHLITSCFPVTIERQRKELIRNIKQSFFCVFWKPMLIPELSYFLKIFITHQSAT